MALFHDIQTGSYSAHTTLLGLYEMCLQDDVMNNCICGLDSDICLPCNDAAKHEKGNISIFNMLHYINNYYDFELISYHIRKDYYKQQYMSVEDVEDVEDSHFQPYCCDICGNKQRLMVYYYDLRTCSICSGISKKELQQIKQQEI